MLKKIKSLAPQRGQIHVYTGNGKGKTTAALGLAIRAAGWGKRVGIIFSDKGGYTCGERKTLSALKPRIHYWVTGARRFTPGKPFRFTITRKDKEEAARGLKIARELFQKKFDVVILDEIITCLGLRMIMQKSVIRLLDKKPKTTELILTGRNCPPSIIKRADLVTEMRQVKHYFYKGVAARAGIEY